MLGHLRDLQKTQHDIQTQVQTLSFQEWPALEAKQRLAEQAYADAIAAFKTCTDGDICKKEAEVGATLESEAFDTSILEIEPMVGSGDRDKIEYQPTILNSQKLGAADYSSRTTFKVESKISCGKTEPIAWWEGHETNAMGVRWYTYGYPPFDCKEGQPIHGSFKTSMFFDGKKFAECSFEGAGAGRGPECVRFDR
jgi:hypothetical protein